MNPILYAIIPMILIAVIAAIIKIRSSGEISNKAIGAMIVITLLATLVIPAIDLIEDESSGSDWQYDDYRVTDAISADGALEIIEIGGINYAHANSIGSGSLSFSDGSQESYNVSKANLDVFLFMGQSNIAYWTGKYIDGVYYDHAIPGDVTPMPTLGKTYYYGSSDSPYTPNLTNLSELGIHDMVNLTTGENTIGSLDAPFAAGYAEATGNKCLVINCGWSGKSITSFIQGGATYNYAKQGYNDALSKINDNFRVSIKGYVFCQGEADRYLDSETYKADFMQMHNLLTGGSFSASRLPVCYIDLVRQYWGGNAYAAQLEIANEVSNVKLASTIADTFSIDDGTLMVDNLHYTQKGQNLIANQLVSYLT